jgi:hypothetical protein
LARAYHCAAAISVFATLLMDQAVHQKLCGTTARVQQLRRSVKPKELLAQVKAGGTLFLINGERQGGIKVQFTWERQ